MATPRRLTSELDLEADVILKGRVAALRLAGYGNNAIARKLGVKELTLLTVFDRWLREELGNDTDVGRHVVELNVARLEALVRKLWPHVAGSKADVSAKNFRGLADLLLRVIEQQVKMVRPSGNLPRFEGDVPDGADLEAECQLAGIK